MYPYPVGGQWAAFTTNYCVVIIVALATTQWRRAPSSPQISNVKEKQVLYPARINLDKYKYYYVNYSGRYAAFSLNYRVAKAAR